MFCFMKSPRLLLEFLVIGVLSLAGYLTLASIDAFESFIIFSRAYERWQIDELFILLPLLCLILALFSLFRLWDLRRECRLRARAEEKARAAEARLSQALEAKKQFMAVMSHEMKTPLTGMIGILTMLEAQERQPRLLELIHLALRRGRDLDRLVNDVLEFVHLDNPGYAELRADFSPRAVLREVWEMLAPRARQKGLEVSEPQLDLPDVLNGFEAATRHIALNLLGNAIKFTDQGSVDLRARYHPTSPEGGLLILEIADTGPGVAAENQKRIFEPFLQLDSTLARAKDGIGLGLSLVKRLVDMMGGEIALTSELGQGSTFRVSLPVLAFSASAQPDASSS